MPVTRDIAIALIIGEDEDDIGLGWFGFRSVQRGQRRE